MYNVDVTTAHLSTCKFILWNC